VESCDVYYYQIGQRLGVDRIAKYARALGLGEKTGIALDDEKPGLIPDSEWKKKRFGQPWFPGETPSIAIGQGYVTVTPLQMANLMATVANGGTLYRPWFVRKVESLDGAVIREYGPEQTRSIALKESTLENLRQALADVVALPQGTGGAARSQIVQIAGKTGTAQVAEMKGATVKTPGSFPTRRRISPRSPSPSSSSTAATAARRRRRWPRKSSKNSSRSKARSRRPPTSRRPARSSRAGRGRRVLIDRRLASHFDWTLLAVAVGLVLASVLTIYSATYSVTEHRASGLAWKQFYWFLMGVGVMIGAATIDYHHVDRIAYPFYAVTLALLTVVYFIGHSGGGSQRWIHLGFFTLQPSEVAKLAIVLALTKFLQYDEPPGGYRLQDLWAPFLLVAPLAVLTLIQPDLGTAIILVVVFFSIVLMGGLRVRSFLYLGAAGVAFMPVAYHFLKPYQRNRIWTFLNPDLDPLGAGYHVIQSKIAIGSGRFFGKGYLNGRTGWTFSRRSTRTLSSPSSPKSGASSAA